MMRDLSYFAPVIERKTNSRAVKAIEMKNVLATDRESRCTRSANESFINYRLISSPVLLQHCVITTQPSSVLYYHYVHVIIYQSQLDKGKEVTNG